MNYRDVACPNCGTIYGVGYSNVPHNVEKIHRICDKCAERLGITLDEILDKRDVDDVLKEIENDILGEDK